MIQKMNKDELDKDRSILEAFLDDYRKYIHSYWGGLSDDSHYQDQSSKTKMQRQLTLVSKIVASVHGGCSLKLAESNTINFRQALSNVLTNNVTQENRIFLESNVESVLNQAIGNIVNETIPSLEIEPVIPIKDDVLKKRCLDLLNAPGSFDRVINQSTQILEERLRSRIPFETLCEIIPEAKNQIGENLAHRLLAPPNPVIVVSDKPEECSAFHKMVVGIIAYLRNPSHHSLNDNTEWTLAWSVVGIVDSLLYELDNAYTTEVQLKTVSQEKKK